MSLKGIFGKSVAADILKIDQSNITVVDAPVVAHKAVGSDSALQEINGPKSISTVTKSSYDWENFKEAEHLEDDLKNASKEG